MEKIEEQKEKEESKPEDNGEGNKPESTPVIDAGIETAKRLEEATEKMQVENDRREAIEAKRALGGQADAGQLPEKLEPVTDLEYSQKVARGEIPMNELLNTKSEQGNN